MISRDMKRKIDMIMDILWDTGNLGAVDALEYITSLMFIRLMDERLMNKIEENELSWSAICKCEPNEMPEHIQQSVSWSVKTLRQGERSVFKKGIKELEFKNLSAHALRSIVDIIDTMDLSGRDVMGDVCEYLLNKGGDAARRGQFCTPSHIIDMIVEMMKPSVEDRILDPAVGTAGFLLSSALYIIKHHALNEITEDERKHFCTDMFTGYDIDLSMLRVGVMNMLLEGVEKPHILQRNVLSEDNKERETYSLILANPPFAGCVPEDCVSKDLLEFGGTERTELLFLVLCLKLLRIGGRCACIVPSGALFGTTETHVAIRRELVENQKLVAVIAMPSGVFRPYTRTNTSVLIFEKTNAGGTDHVWFYDMKADGYSLDDRRSEIEDNDIPDILKRYSDREAEMGRARTEKSFMVSRKELAENDYILSVKKYREMDCVAEEYPTAFEIMSNLRELDEQIAQTMDEIEDMLGM